MNQLFYCFFLIKNEENLWLFQSVLLEELKFNLSKGKKVPLNLFINSQPTFSWCTEALAYMYSDLNNSQKASIRKKLLPIKGFFTHIILKQSKLKETEISKSPASRFARQQASNMLS